MFRIFLLTTLASVTAVPAWADSHIAEPAESAAEEDTSARFADADLDAAEAIFSRNCRACHGNKAQGVASYPKLSDKTPDYIADKLETYRAGERIGPNSVLMIQNARDLSDEDIVNLSAYVTTAFD